MVRKTFWSPVLIHGMVTPKWAGRFDCILILILSFQDQQPVQLFKKYKLFWRNENSKMRESWKWICYFVCEIIFFSFECNETRTLYSIKYFCGQTDCCDFHPCRGVWRQSITILCVHYFLIVTTVRFFFQKQLLYLILCFMIMMDLLDAFVSIVIVFMHTVIKFVFVVCLKISKSITDIRTVGLLCL